MLVGWGGRGVRLTLQGTGITLPGDTQNTELFYATATQVGINQILAAQLLMMMQSNWQWCNQNIPYNF